MYRLFELPLYILPSISGLTAWVDYFPVQAETGGRSDSYDATGYFTPSSVLSDITGLVAWVDYVPGYVAGSVPWRFDSDGYIPVSAVA